MMSYNQLRELFFIINEPYIYIYISLIIRIYYFKLQIVYKNNMEVIMMTRVAIPNDTIGTKQYQHNR